MSSRLDLRCSAVKYQVAGTTGGEKVDASSIGVGSTLLFGKGGIVYGR